jgi:hypothetical protein
MSTEDVTKMKEKDGESEMSSAKDKDSLPSSHTAHSVLSRAAPSFRDKFWKETRKQRRALKKAKAKSPQEYNSERSKILLKVVPKIWKSKSAMAKTAFPVDKLKKRLRNSSANYVKVTTVAGAALAAALDYAVSELLDVACKAADLKRQTSITPRHMTLGIPQDDSLAQLFKNVTIPNGGVVPHFHPELAQGYRQSKKRKVVTEDFSDVMDKTALSPSSAPKHKSPATSSDLKGKESVSDKEKDKDKGKSPIETIRRRR